MEKFRVPFIPRLVAVELLNLGRLDWPCSLLSSRSQEFDMRVVVKVFSTTDSLSVLW